MTEKEVIEYVGGRQYSEMIEYMYNNALSTLIKNDQEENIVANSWKIDELYLTLLIQVDAKNKKYLFLNAILKDNDNMDELLDLHNKALEIGCKTGFINNRI